MTFFSFQTKYKPGLLSAQQISIYTIRLNLKFFSKDFVVCVCLRLFQNILFSYQMSHGEYDEHRFRQMSPWYPMKRLQAPLATARSLFIRFASFFFSIGTPFEFLEFDSFLDFPVSERVVANEHTHTAI